ncbi:MAG: hypothetical protein IJ424_07470 [Oscillospiraceae bacterium]|nr:hypothetical protein [Oscillospiraceae bacterium]
MKRILALLLAVLVCITLCSCKDDKHDKTDISSVTDSTTENVPDNVVSQTLPQPDDETVVINTSAKLYGSYLTMCSDESIEYPYIKVFENYGEVSEYYESNSESFLFGRKFTLACASFNDSFLKENDVMMLVLSEDSSYINHKVTQVAVTADGVKFEIERHMPLEAPKSNTQYHLIFTAPKGTFDGVEDLSFDINMTDIIDKADDQTFDAERYRMIYPEFYPFVYRADAKGEAETVVDTINSYAELISFYEQYNDEYDLEYKFKKHVGTLYDEKSFFNEYVLLAIIVPSKNMGEGISVDELFIYNLEIYMSVENTSPAVVSDNTECYVLATAVAKSDLDGVNLEWFNISFN